MNTNVSLLKNFAANYGRELVLVAIALALNPYLFSALGPDGFGVIALTGSTAGLLRLLDAGMAHSIARFVSRFESLGERQGSLRVVNTSLLLYSITGVFAAAIVHFVGSRYLGALGVPPSIQAPAKTVFSLVAMSLAFRFPGNAFEGALRGLQRFDLANSAVVADRVVYALACVVSISLLGLDLVSVGASLLLGASISQLVRVLTLRRALGELRLSWSYVDRHTIRELLGFGAMAFLTQISWFLERTVGRVLVSAFLGAAALGVYALLTTATSLLFRMMTAVTNVVLPVASQLESTKDTAGLRRLWFDGSRMVFAIVAPAGIWIAVAAHPILLAWIGPEMASSATLLTWLVALQLLELAAGTGNMLLIGSGRVRNVGVSYIVGGCVTTLALYSLLAWTPLGLFSVVPAMALGILVRRVAVFLELRAALDIGLGAFAQRVLVPSVICAIPAAAIAWGALWLVGVDSRSAGAPSVRVWAALALSASATMVVYLGASWFVMLDTQERFAIRQWIADRVGSARQSTRA